MQARPKTLQSCGHGCQGTLRLLRAAGLIALLKGVCVGFVAGGWFAAEIMKEGEIYCWIG